MTRLLWQIASVQELSQQLVDASLQQSCAVSDATVYHFRHDGLDKLAISLKDGQVVMISPDVPQAQRRRRQDLHGETAPPEPVATDDEKVK